jgi:hypothetical protein
MEVMLDEWELKLKSMVRELQSCQKQEGIKSCLSCRKVHNCELRDRYVHSVYSSMNKGAGGGFEF